MLGYWRRLRGAVVTAVAVGVIGVGVVAYPGGDSGAPPETITCHQTAANSSQLGTAVSAASAGQNVCLTADVDYGTWNGTNKAITLIAQSGTGAPDPTSPSLDLNLGPGDANFTIDGGMDSWDSPEGMILSGLIAGGSNGAQGARDFTLRDFQATGTMGPGGKMFNFEPGPSANSNILIDHANFHDIANGEGAIYVWHSCGAGEVYADCDGGGSVGDTGLTIRDSLFTRLSPDAIKVANNEAVTILNNKCLDSHESFGTDGNHTDCLQFTTGAGSVVRGNWIQDCDQAIFADDGTESLTIAHNLIVDCDAHWITVGQDNPGSDIYANTITDSGADGIICGNNRSTLPDPSLSSIYDNITPGIQTAGTNGGPDCTPERNDHNFFSASLTYTGGAPSSHSFGSGPAPTWDAFSDACLVGTVGMTSASDSGPVGVCGGDYNASTDGPPTGEGY